MGSLIGSITAYAGPVSDNVVDRDAWEQANGWLFCDGRELDRTNPTYTALNAAIGETWGSSDHRDLFNIPDLRGLFLRGVDRVDPRYDRDVDHRSPSGPGGNEKRAVGSLQLAGTALPADRPFVVAEAGKHSHETVWGFEIDASRDVDSQNNTVAFPGDFQFGTNEAPAHNHSLQGGSPETRPVKVYVNWVICFR